MGIGVRLKEARVERNISLDELQETTKIQKRYLVAIEEGNFDVLPGKFYARAFIKEYATAVGLDPNEFLDEFKEEIPEPDEESTQYTSLRRSRKESRQSRSNAIFSFIPTLIVILLIIGIAFAMWYFYVQKNAADQIVEESDGLDDNEVIITDPNNKEDNTTTNDEDDEVQSNTEEDDKENNQELKLVEQGTGANSESIFDFYHSGEKVTVTMESIHNTWLDVQNTSGEKLYYEEFTTEKSPLELDVTGEETIYFQIGYAPGLSIKINDVELEYPLDPNEYVVQKLTINIKNEAD